MGCAPDRDRPNHRVSATAWELFWDDDRHNATRLSEGWGVYPNYFEGHSVMVRLERCDAELVFATDAEAIEFVKSRAREGSELHKLALRLVGEEY